MTKGLSENTKNLITQLRSIGNTDEAIATILKIDLELVKSFRSLSLINPEDDKEEMIKLYRKGLTTTQIGKELGWSRATVQNILKEVIPDEYRGKPRIDTETDEAIKQMLAEGCSSKEISEKLNVSYQAIRARKKNVNSYKQLTTDELREIAYLIYIDKKGMISIAKQFDVHHSTIYRLKAKIEKSGGYEKWLESTK